MNKTLTKLLALVGGVAILGGVVIGCMEGFAPSKYKPSNWGNHAPAEDNKGNEGGNGDDAANYEVAALSLDVVPAGVVYENEEGQSVISYSENMRSCTITAKVLTSDGSAPNVIQSVTWELSETDAGITMTVNGMSATFSTVEGFNKPITATCTSTLNREVSVSYTFDSYYYDYEIEAFSSVEGLKKSRGCYTSGGYNGSMFFYEIPSEKFAGSNYFLDTITPIGNGTVYNTLKNCTIEITPTTYLLEAINNQGISTLSECKFSKTFDKSAFTESEGKYSLSDAARSTLSIGELAAAFTGQQTGSWMANYVKAIPEAIDKCMAKNVTANIAYLYSVKIVIEWEHGLNTEVNYQVSGYFIPSDIETDVPGRPGENIIL